MKITLIIIILIILSSCKKDELPIPKTDRGDVLTAEVAMTSNYRYQLYYDLETNSIVGQNLKTDWDLGFQCGSSEWQITLNGAKYMAVWRTGQTNFSSVTDTSGANWRYDNVRGKLDSTAIGDWQSSPQVYIINRGYNWAGSHLGFFKMMVQSVNTTEYEIRVAELNGNGDLTHTLTKNATRNRMGFSFDAGQILIEPPKTDWDLYFSQYTHVYDNGDTYLVTGVLQNPYQTVIAQDETHDFTSISDGDLSSFVFSDHINTIGFDWKVYSFAISAFEINSDINYIIETSDSRFFKLHFIDFYNQSGEKGHPTFEMQEL